MRDYNWSVWTINELDKKQLIKLFQLSNRFRTKYKNIFFFSCGNWETRKKKTVKGIKYAVHVYLQSLPRK